MSVKKNNDTSNFNTLLWNSQSLRPKLSSFENVLVQENIHIAVVCETWLEPESRLKVRDYNIYRSDRDDSYGGVAVFTHKSIQSQRVRASHVNSNIQIMHIKVYNCVDIENIIAVYCPPNKPTRVKDWDDIFCITDKKTLFLGDFNGHHSNWSIKKPDQRGHQIYEALSENHLVVLNDCTPTRIKLVNGILQQSTPDISIATSDIALKFDYRVSNETLGSDHRIVKMTVFISLSRLPVTKKRNFKRADFTLYKEIAEKLFEHYSISADLQKSYDVFVDYINIAAEISIPYINVSQNPATEFTPKPYWNPTLSKAVAERRLALSRFRRNPTPYNLDTLKSKINIAQNLIRKAKINNFQNFCSSLDQFTNAKELWDKMKWIKGYNLAQNRECIDEQTANRLLHDMTPDFVSPARPKFSSSNHLLDIPISVTEVENSIPIKNTSPGSDDISYLMIKHLPINAKHFLTQLYNFFYESGFVPKQWRDIIIVPIPKPGRDPTAPSSLRPISMLSCLCKILHNILNKRLDWFCEKHNLFSNYTTGFRKGHSCYDNLSILTYRILKGFTENKPTVACFLDINNAYNHIDIRALLSTLDDIGAGSKLCVYLWNFLNHRTLKISVRNNMISRNTSLGLAQGDPMSPLLFNIATRKICNIIDNVCISQYADDFVIYDTCATLLDGTQNLQLALNKLVDLLTEVGLEVSISKTKICVFNRGFRRDTVQIKIKDIFLDVVDNVKYLGVWFDRSLRWSKHLNEMKEKVMKFLNILKIFRGPGWGIHPTHLRRLYLALIRSRMDYGSFLYDNCCKSLLNKIDILQNQGLRIIGGFIKSTPVHVMENDLCIPPLMVRRHYLAAKYWLKCKSILDNELINILSNLVESPLICYWNRKKLPLLIHVQRYLTDLPIHRSEQLGMFTLKIWTSSVDLLDIIKWDMDYVDKSKNSYDKNELLKLCNQAIYNHYSEFYKLFTDGSKDDYGVGAAFYDSQLNIHCKLRMDSRISIMHAELIAILEALSYITSIDYHSFVVLSDSKSALQHLARCTSTFRGTPIAYLILESILTLRSKNKKVILQWIPAHTGVVGNEIADILAKKATHEGIKANFLPTASDLLSTVKQRCSEQWSEYFDKRSLTKGIWYKTIQPILCRCPWFDGSGMSGNDVVTALRLRSGHIPLNSFGYLMKKTPSPLCTECDVIEDAYHIMMECVRNEAERLHFFQLINYTNEMGICNSVLSDPSSNIARKLYSLVQIAIKRRNCIN